MSAQCLLHPSEYSKVSAKVKKTFKNAVKLICSEIFFIQLFQDDFQWLLPTIENNSKCYQIYRNCY